MARCTNITRRGAVYYVRVAVPSDLQAHLKKAETWKSLRTEKFTEAKERAHEVLLKLNAEWGAIRSRLQPQDTTALSDDERQQFAGRFYREELELDQKRRASLPTADDVEAAQVSILSPRHQKRFQDVSVEDLGLVAFDVALDFLVARDAAKIDADSRAQLLVTLRKHLGSGETALGRKLINGIPELAKK